MEINQSPTSLTIHSEFGAGTKDLRVEETDLGDVEGAVQDGDGQLGALLRGVHPHHG